MTTPEFERRLLESAADDGPTPEQRRANRASVMRAAGIVATAGMATAVAASSAPAAGAATSASADVAGALAGAGAGPGVGAGTTSTVATTSKLLLWVKVSSVILGLGGVTGAAVEVMRSSDDVRPPVVAQSPNASNTQSGAARASRGPTPPSSALDAPPASEASSPSEAASPTSEDVAQPAQAESKTGAAPSAARARTPARPRAVTIVDPLASEVALLERARRCLSTSDLACATANLDAHTARFVRGTLADEATVLHIDLARAQGDSAKARDLARRLLDERPNGPYAARARTILTEP